MFLGHYGIAFAAKRLAPRTSLGATFFAAQFLDEIWPVLILAGVEHVRVVPGIMAATPFEFVSYPISHSLLTAVGWAVLVGLGWYAWWRDARGARVLAALVLSHWFLDLPMHQPDLPLWPGSGMKLGLGLWNSLAATWLLELGLLLAGVALYAHATRARDRIGRVGLWGLVLLLIAGFAGAGLGTPPPDERAVALGTLSLWLFVPWAWWVDRHREPVVAT